MREYKELCERILIEGIDKSDRTGVGTRSISGAEIRFDMSEGFPIVTEKKVPFKLISSELLWFINGDTNLRYLLQNGNHIWDEWPFKRWVESEEYANEFPEIDMSNFGIRAVEDEDFAKVYKAMKDLFCKRILEDDDFAEKWGDCGPIYGKQWVSSETNNEIVYVEPRKKEYDGGINYPLFELLDVEKDDSDKLIGKVFESENFGSFKVLSRNGSDSSSRPLYKIQFLKTGYIKDKVRREVVVKGNVKDVYYPSINGVACSGDYSLSTDLDINLKRIWTNMIDRCYNKDCKEYIYYGAKGIFVEKNWLIFSNFINDVKKLPNWDKKKLEPSFYQLDKDYYNSNCYSLDTCVWLTKQENILYAHSKAFKAITPDGLEIIDISTGDFGRKRGLNYNSITRVLRGERKQYKGYHFEYIENGSNYRYQLPINQLLNVINTLKTDKFSRRMVVSSWNPGQLHKMSLTPCHHQFQFLVRDGYLDLIWDQRSVDIFLGLPFNISSYAILLSIVAKEVDLKPGYLIGHLKDVHIYKNHMNQVMELLIRDSLDLPKLWLNPEVNNVFDYKLDDIKLIGYKSHGAIKAPVAV